MTAKTRAALTTQATTTLADNTAAAISEQDIRDMVTDLIDSAFLLNTDRGYGSIYVASGATGQTTNASADTFDQVTGFTTDGADDATVVTADAANDKITAAAGTYLVSFQCSFTGTASAEITLQLYDNTNAIALTQCQTIHKLNASGDEVSIGFTGIAAVAGTSDLIVRVASNGTSDTFTPIHMNLTLWRVGD